MNKLNQIVFSILICCVRITIFPSASLTQPVNPLVIDRSDPLIPQGYGRRELTSFEKYRIQKAISRLDKTAEDELDLGNSSSAMETWYRRLRLTRIIDTYAEIKALGRIGAIAWEENLSSDVRNIANRLIAIQTDKNKDKKLSYESLNSLASAYESVRYLDKAIDVYQQILARNKESNDKVLDKLGELYLGIFDYQNAALIYEQKLTSVKKDQQEIILKTLIDIYDHEGETNKSINIKQELIKQYINQNKNKKISALEIAIARDYETLKQYDEAIEFYTQASTTASKSEQQAIASDALTRMGKLYQEQGNLEQASDTYNKLLTIQQKSYNYYGLVNSYDILGNIYLKLNKNKLAQQSFQEGLNIANTIDYKVDYFRNRIKQ